VPTAKLRIDPWALARYHGELSGAFKCADLGRFAALVHDPGGVVRYELSFGLDEQHRPLVRGMVVAETAVICQRCLAPMDLKLTADVRLVGVRNDDEAKGLSGDFDPLLLTDQGESLATLVENELLLALSAAPTHPRGGDCRLPARYRASAAGTGRRPFAELARPKKQMK